MHETFLNPPRQYRMLQIIHGFPKDQGATAQSGYAGDLQEAGFLPPTDLAISRLLDLLAERGYGGVVCNVGFDNYLESEEEWQRFLHGFAECRRRGLRLWIYDERGYPSGKAGTLVLRDHPEFETRGLVCAQTRGAPPLRHALPADERIDGGPLKVLACPVVEGELDLEASVDLTSRVAGGQAEVVWEPAAEVSSVAWAVLSFHVRRMREGTHIVTNVSDDNPYINIMDPDAVRRFIEVTHEAYAQRLGDEALATVEAMFTDEPSLMTFYLREEPGLLPAAPWSPQLFERFEAQKGYSLLPKLPALFEDCGPQTRRVRLDFWHVVSQLVEESFYGQIEEWCLAHGVQASGHALTEERLWWHVGFEGDLYRDLRRMGWPGIDQLSSDPAGLVRAGGIPIEKLVSSVAHMSGAEGCMSETSAYVQRMGQVSITDEHRFGTLNYQYVLGLTQITSYYGLEEMAPEVMREFNDHAARLTFMLTGGVHVAPVAVYYPIHTAWAGFQVTATGAYLPCDGALGREVSEVFEGVSRELLWSQVDYDHLDDQALVEATISEGQLQVAGESFLTVVLPHVVALPLSTYRVLQRFVGSGGSLVSCGPLPGMASTDGTDDAIREISDALAGHVRVEVVERPQQVPEVLSYFVPRDLSLAEPCPDLLYVHRLKDGHHVYFVANCGDQPVTRRVTVALIGEPELWIPRSGERLPLTAESDAAGTRFELSLRPFEGVFVVFAAGAEVIGAQAANQAACCFERTGECGRCQEAEAR